MIKEQYISLDTARMLKDASFNVPCRRHYTKSGSTWETAVPETNDESRDFTWFPCPTQALAARWLREVYGIMIVSFFDDYMSKWYYVIDGVKKQSVIKCVQSASDYDNYEEAIEEGLQEALRLIIKDKGNEQRND